MKHTHHIIRLLTLALVSCALAALLSGCTSMPPAPEGSGSAGADVSAPVGSGSASVPTPPDGGSSAAGSGTADGSQDLEASGSGEAAAYDFSQPAPEREAVDNRYFDDAAFVGDSRTDGFLIYSGIGTGKNLTSHGLTTYRPEDIQGLYLNFHYDGSTLQCITGTSLKTFSMDKSIEREWDTEVKSILKSKNIEGEY